MHNQLLDAMTRPDCLLGVVPDHGGMWVSPLRANTPRNFAARPMTWTELINAASGTTGDWRFAFTFHATAANSTARILQGSPQTSALIGEISQVTFGTGPKLFYVHFGVQYADDTAQKAEITMTTDADHNMVMSRAGQRLSVEVDGVEMWHSDRTGVPLPLYESATYPTSAFSGFIRSAKLTASGTVLWEAAYSDLYDTSNPYPSAVPLDFGAGGNATSAEFSREFIRMFNETFDVGHDWEFRTRITIRPEDLEKASFNLFYDAASRFFIYDTEHDYLLSIFRTVRDGKIHNTLYEVLARGDSAILGSHDFITKRVGNTYTTSFDDYSVSRVADYEHERHKTTNINLNAGILHYAELLDLTTGKTVWRYPSEPERVRLLTYKNIRTDRGAFEANNPQNDAEVITTLDLTGRSELTAIIRYQGEFTGVNGNIGILLSQGVLWGSSIFRICVTDSGKAVIDGRYLPKNGTTSLGYGYSLSAASSHFDRTMHTLAVSIASDGTIASYLDGDLIDSRMLENFGSLGGLATTGYNRSARCYIHPQMACTSPGFAFFDRAMTAGEIKALT